MVVLRGEDVWPRRRRLRWGLARFGIPVLIAAAALFGAAVSAVVLVTFWGTEAARRQSADAKLAASTKRVAALERESAGLRAGLTRSRSASARLERLLVSVRAAARTLAREDTALVASTASLRGRAGSLQRSSGAVSKLAATLASDLDAVRSYVASATPGSLDLAYLQTQLDYLRPVIARVRSQGAELGSEASGYGADADAFVARARAYAARLRALADSG